MPTDHDLYLHSQDCVLPPLFGYYVNKKMRTLFGLCKTSHGRKWKISRDENSYHDVASNLALPDLCLFSPKKDWPHETRGKLVWRRRTMM